MRVHGRVLVPGLYGWKSDSGRFCGEFYYIPPPQHPHHPGVGSSVSPLSPELLESSANRPLSGRGVEDGGRLGKLHVLWWGMCLIVGP